MCVTVWEALVAALAVSAAGGVAFLSYRHPEVYEKLAFSIILAICGLFVLLFGFDMGVDQGFRAVDDFLETGKWLEARDTADESQVLSWRLVLGFVASTAYLAFLGMLPHMIVAARGEDGGDRDDTAEEQD